MKRIFIDKLNRDFKLELCKVNKEVICSIPKSCLESLTRSLTEIDKMEVTIKKYISDFSGKKVLFGKSVRKKRIKRIFHTTFFIKITCV